MKKVYLLAACAVVCTCVFYFLKQAEKPFYGFPAENIEERKKKKKDGYDGAAQRDLLEFEKTVDPALGYVPAEVLTEAVEYTENQKRMLRASRQQGMLLWTERGPVYDSVGLSNTNGRAGAHFTAGRIRGLLVDTLGDPSGNTVLAGGVAGGLWKCTNFLSSTPNWQPINDYFNNLAISSIAQNPINPNELYFSTGEPTSNADAVNGDGVWKSTDRGRTWNQITSTKKFIRTFKLLFDAAGNLYLAARVTTSPVLQTGGLFRSKDGGLNWTDITPPGLTYNQSNGAVVSNNTCQDIEISSTGRFHGSFSYNGNVVHHFYTDDPANAGSNDWKKSSGIREFIKPTTGRPESARRMELASAGNIVYAVTVDASASYIDSTYKSTDGGATFVKQNSTRYPDGLGSQQGWYNLTLSINPDNSNEIIIGGLDAYRSSNSGVTLSRMTYWVTTAPYVHADHHNLFWWKMPTGENRIIIACDGGLFLSRDGGKTWADRNRNFAIKQFYSAAIHPEAGSNYLLAGAQDNGTHQLKYSGLSSSVEVTGGDGCFVHINQKNPAIQFASYVYNSYHRSNNGGQTWASATPSGSQGLFVNPFDYDDNLNIMYASNGASSAPNGQIRRWLNANTAASNTTNVFTIGALKLPTDSGNATAFKVSPYTANRVFIGSSNGKILRLENANTVTAATINNHVTQLSPSSFPRGFVNCINVGTSDDFLVAVMTNYGINNVWYSKDGGTTWSAVDGNLPNMPVRWATFVPGYDDKLILATEAGVFITQELNGNNTVWTPNPGFPSVRTDMLKIRASDNTIVAATHGRGLFTAVIPTTEEPEVLFSTAGTTVTETKESLDDCRGFKDHLVNVGILNAPKGDATIHYNVKAEGTATLGVDYDFTTNGDFNNPSSKHVFANGATASQVVTVRVYNDGVTEPEENLTISFSISGTTNAIPSATNNRHEFIIKDNPVPAPTIFEAKNYSIGTANSDQSILTTPFEGKRLKHRLQVLYTAAELKAQGLTEKALITSLILKVKTKNTTQPFNGFTISIANSNLTRLGNFFNGSFAYPFSIVYSSNYSTVPGDNVFRFTQPYVWDGVSNIVVQYCFDNTGSAVEGASDVVEGMSSPLGAGTINYASVYSDHTVSTDPGCSIGAAWVNLARVNATFTASFGANRIPTAAGISRSEYLNAESDLWFYTPDSGYVLGRVRNHSDLNYACTEVSIDRAGTGASRFWNSNKKNMLMDKSFRIVPSVNKSDTVSVTFYFTREEKEGWEAATGQSWSNIQIVKTSGRVSDVTPANAQPNNNGTVEEVVDAVHGTFGTGYTLTGTFTSGFGGFGFGTPGRQFTNLIVKADNAAGTAGRSNGSVSDIDVSWTTSSETGSTVFEVEKSYDDVSFHKVATVAASGNKFTPTTYHFIDKENVELNYYRIRMLHQDLYVQVSSTTLLRNNNAAQNMFVLTNPFRNDIRLRFAKVPKTQMVFSLYDMQGKLVKRYIQAPSSDVAVFSTSTSNLVSNGVYMVDVLVDGRHYKAKLVKQ